MCAYDFPLVCRECDEVCPAPDLPRDEVTGWLTDHRLATGHDAWVERPDAAATR